MESNIAAFDLPRHLILRRDCEDGYYYVGPFATADVACAWAEENDGRDIRWHPVVLDPARPPPVEPPGAIPALVPDADDLYPNGWWPSQGAIGAFHLLMLDPARLVGPFLCHRDAWAWGQDYLRRTNDELWQVVWLDHPAAGPRLLTPAQGKAASDQVFAALARDPTEFRHLTGDSRVQVAKLTTWNGIE